MTTSLLQNAADTYSLERAPSSNYNTSTKLYTKTLAGAGARAYLHFTRPFPLGVTIISAKLRLVSDYQYIGTQTNVVQRIAATWSTSKLTWSNAPAVTGASVSVSKTSPAAGTVWEWDITALMQTVSNGAAWYGLRINNTTSVTTRFHSSQAANVSVRPVLEIVWSDVPKTPTQLYPSGGRAVATNKPTLQCNFVDISGDTTMAAMQVQINSTDSWATPAFDSGTVATSVPEVDLSTTAYAGVGAGATVFWRCRVQDGAGLWSNWSAAASFQYQTYGTLTLVNPAFAEVYRNAVKNPRAASVITGWAGGAGSGGTASVARVATGGPFAEADTFARLTWSVASTGPNSTLYAGAVTASAYATAVVPGEIWSARFWSRASFGTATFQGRINYYTSAGAFISSTNGTSVNTAANTWNMFEVLNSTVPATAAFAIPIIYHTGGVNPGVGATLDMTAAVMVKSATLPSSPLYWDGSMTDTIAMDFSWAGTVEQSDSILKTSYIEEATPPISWTFTGRTQKAFQVSIYEVLSLGQPKLRWTSGKITSTATAYTLPAGAIPSTAGTYQIMLQVWDTLDREATPGFPIDVRVVRQFVLQWTAAVGGLTAFTVAADAVLPWVTINWSRGTMPDNWNIYRNGKLLDNMPGVEPFVSGTSYAYIDRAASPRRTNTYLVIPVVNGRGSNAVIGQNVTPKALSTVLSDKDGTYPVIIMNSSRDITMDEDVTVFEPTGNSRPVAIFGSTTNGFRGSVSGVLAGSVMGLTADQVSDRFEELSKMKGELMWLTLVDRTIEVFIVNPKLNPRAKNEEVIYDVSFEFYQTDAN